MAVRWGRGSWGRGSAAAVPVPPAVAAGKADPLVITPPGTGSLLAAAGSRWLRIVLAVGLLVLLARTKAAPIAYLILIPAAFFVGSPTMRATLDRWTTFWGGKPA